MCGTLHVATDIYHNIPPGVLGLTEQLLFLLNC